MILMMNFVFICFIGKFYKIKKEICTENQYSNLYFFFNHNIEEDIFIKGIPFRRPELFSMKCFAYTIMFPRLFVFLFFA